MILNFIQLSGFALIVKTVYQVLRLSCTLSYLRVSFHIVYHAMVNIAGTVIYRELWNFYLRREKTSKITKNSETLIYNVKNYGTMEQLWYYSKL